MADGQVKIAQPPQLVPNANISSCMKSPAAGKEKPQFLPRAPVTTNA
ncbi:hypothetical protein [Microbulbifer echini]